MKKYVMNKNVLHSGNMYPKDSEICESDAGFEELVKLGHASVLEFKDVVVEEEVASEEPKSKKKK
jgi:hypothetical protein